MKKFKVKVTNSGVLILPNGRKIRTPVELTIKEDKLEEYKVQFRAKSLTYKITEVIDEANDQEFEIPRVSEKVVIEELTTTLKTTAEPKSFLDKLISESEK